MKTVSTLLLVTLFSFNAAAYEVMLPPEGQRLTAYDLHKLNAKASQRKKGSQPQVDFIRLTSDFETNTFFAEVCEAPEGCQVVSGAEIDLYQLVEVLKERELSYFAQSAVSGIILAISGGKSFVRLVKKNPRPLRPVYYGSAVIVAMQLALEPSGRGIKSSRDKVKFIETIITADSIDMPLDAFKAELNDIIVEAKD